MTNEERELSWLRYFAKNADFGPAHEDVVAIIIKRYEGDTGIRVPDEWREGYIFDEDEE